MISLRDLRFLSRRTVGRVAQRHDLDDPGRVGYAQDLSDLFLGESPDPTGGQAFGGGGKGQMLQGDGQVDGVSRDPATHDAVRHETDSRDHHRRRRDEALMGAGQGQTALHSGSRTTMNFQGWRLEPEGASRTASRTRSSFSSSTGRARYERQA